MLRKMSKTSNLERRMKIDRGFCINALLKLDVNDNGYNFGRTSLLVSSGKNDEEGFYLIKFMVLIF